MAPRKFGMFVVGFVVVVCECYYYGSIMFLDSVVSGRTDGDYVVA